MFTQGCFEQICSLMDKLEMFSSVGSVWLVSGKWDSVMTFPGGGLTYCAWRFVDSKL
jgi:hypothetical protein